MSTVSANPIKTEKPTFTSLNEDVFSEICGKLDYKSIVSLRKVNVRCREFLEKNPIGNKFINGSINVYDNSLSCSFDEFTAEYVRENGGCKVGKNWRMRNAKSFPNDDFRQILIADLKHFLGNQKSTLENLQISIREKRFFNLHGQIIFDRIVEILSSRKKPLGTQCLSVSILNESHLMNVITQIDSTVLRSLYIGYLKMSEQDSMPISMGLVETAHWKNLTTLSAPDCVFEAPIDYFLHLNNATFQRENISFEDIQQLKERFHRNPEGIEKFEVFTVNQIDKAPFLNRLPPSEPSEMSSDPRWYFETKNWDFVFFLLVRGYKITMESFELESFMMPPGPPITVQEWPENINN